MDIAIMYHYVKERNWRGIFPLEPHKFEEQVELLSKYYNIVCPDELNNPPKDKPYCVLTFDDGTKDQYQNAFSILKKKGIPGYFTVMSGPLENREIPIIHLVHAGLSFYSDEEIWNELNELYNLKEVPELSNIYSYEKDNFRRYNKYTFNFYLPEIKSREYLEKKLFRFFKSRENFIEDYYINKPELIQMRKEGMTLGVHCVNHLPYSGDANEFYMREIEPCVEYLKNQIGVIPEWYTPAFGGGERKDKMINDLEPILIHNGFKGGFTTIPGFNKGLSNFWLNRFDCVDIPPFKK